MTEPNSAQSDAADDSSASVATGRLAGEFATDDSTLGSRIVRGALWSGLNTVVLRLGNIVLMAIVIRLITPHDFGVFAVAVTVHAVVSNISSLGLLSVLTRNDIDQDRAGPTVKTLSLISCGVLACAMTLWAGPLASAMGAPDAVASIRVMSLAVLMIGIYAVPGALLAREFRQDRIFFANIIAFVPSNVLLVVLAVHGDGALAFAWSRVLGQLIAGAYMAYSVSERYSFGLSRKQTKLLLAIGLPLAGADIVSTVLLNVDYAFIARMLGPERLGLYMLAFNVANWTTWLLGAMVTGVGVAAFSRVSRDVDQLTDAIVKSHRAVAIFAWPACTVSAVSAIPLIETIYGERWVGAATVLAVLAPYAVLLTHALVFSQLLKGSGHGNLLLGIQVAWLAVLVPAMVVGVKVGGTTGAAVAHVIVICAFVIPVYLLAVHRLMGVRPTVLFVAVRVTIPGVIAAGLADFAVTHWLTLPWLELVLGVLAGALAYLLVTADKLASVLPESGGGAPVRVLRTTIGVVGRPRRFVVALARRV